MYKSLWIIPINLSPKVATNYGDVGTYLIVTLIGAILYGL